MNRIKMLREKSGLTQTALGKQLGVEKSTISKYENGTLDLSSKTISILCDIFQVSADYLLCRSNDDNVKEPQISESQTNTELNPEISENISLDSETYSEYSKVVAKVAKLSKSELKKILQILEILHEEENEVKNIK